MTWSRVEIVAAWDEGPLMRGLRLAGLPSYRAGQALKVRHGAASALFALATAHGAGRGPELLLRRGGGVADALIAELGVGREVEVEGPLGPGFPLDLARGKDVVCVAAGSGISAIRTVVETLLDERAAYGRIALFYGQERAEEFAYANARAAWIAAGVAVTLCAHAPDERWPGARGFVQEVLAHQGLGVAPERAVAYLCGMPSMITSVRDAVAPLGLSPERTYLNF